VIYVFTHDSIGLGEDGPTHQPIEHLAALRAMPNLTVMRPGDANEVSQAWRRRCSTPTAPPCWRSPARTCPPMTAARRHGRGRRLLKGGYVFFERADSGLQVVLIGTGSELDIAYNAASQLAGEGVGVRVVSLPSWELFEQQDDAYRVSVLPPAVAKVSPSKPATTFGWSRWVGNDPARERPPSASTTSAPARPSSGSTRNSASRRTTSSPRRGNCFNLQSLNLLIS
jgi:transketolase